MEAPVQKTVAAQTVIALRHDGGHDEIGSVYRKLHAWAQEKGIAIQGKGLTIFLTQPSAFNPKDGAFEVCLPIPAGVQGDAEVTVKELPACDVAAAQVTGPYGRIPAHYSEMLAWMAADGLTAIGSPREVYIKGPKTDGSGNPEEYITEIQFLIG